MKFNFDWNYVAAGAPYITISGLALGFNAPSIALLGNPEEVIAYADRGNIRMRSKYKRMIRHEKKRNVAVAAIARELACYVWGIMTNHIEPREEGKKAA